MNRFLIGSLIVLVFIAYSCDSGKSLATSRQTAQTAYNSGDYTKALRIWEGIIGNFEQKSAEKQCPVYTEAGMAAFKLNQTEKAEKYLKQAAWGELANANTYLTLSQLYKSKDNLSLELENLEIYSEKYPTGNDINYINKRLFLLYAEIESWDMALETWKKMNPESKKGDNIQESLLMVFDGMEMNTEAVATAKNILAADANSIDANKWLANYYFWKAEKRYQGEMKIYEQKKTRKQYSHLLKVIDEVALEYKESLKYGKQLYKLEPIAENAKLLGNTYDRLNYKDKAKYYQSLGNK